jgi:hypothetical protein
LYGRFGKSINLEEKWDLLRVGAMTDCIDLPTRCSSISHDRKQGHIETHFLSLNFPYSPIGTAIRL